MSHTRAPNPANNPTTITLPDDLTDPKDASSVNVPFAALQDLVSRRIDGFGGGNYAPVSSIIIGGAGIETSGGDGLFVHDSAEFVDTALVAFDCNPVFRAGILLNTSGSFISSRAWAQSGVSSFTNSIVVDTGGKIILQGTGHIRERAPEEQAGVADITRNSSDTDTIAYVGLTADRNCKITASGVGSPAAVASSDGDTILVTLVPLGANANTVSLLDDVNNPLVDLKHASGSVVWARLKKFATGGWRVTEYGVQP